MEVDRVEFYSGIPDYTNLRLWIIRGSALGLRHPSSFFCYSREEVANLDRTGSSSHRGRPGIRRVRRGGMPRKHRKIGREVCQSPKPAIVHFVRIVGVVRDFGQNSASLPSR